jgi:hypothetical protein
VDHGVASLERAGDIRWISQVALNLGEAGAILKSLEDVAVDIEVQDRDPMARCQQLRNKPATDIACTARHQNIPISMRHASPQLAEELRFSTEDGLSLQVGATFKRSRRGQGKKD